MAAVAFADALTSVDLDNDDILQEKIKQAYLAWGKNFINAGFLDSEFEEWLVDKKHSPRKSAGNGAAAIATVIPYLCNDSERVEEIARLTAEITCADSADIFNAQFAAVAVYYAMWSGENKTRLKKFLEHYIGEEIVESSAPKNIVVEAVLDFFNSTDIFSAIDNSIARGGDIRSRAAISGSMAEVFYGLPFSARSLCNKELDEKFFKVLKKFDRAFRKNFLKVSNSETSYSAQCLEKAVSRFHENNNAETFSHLIREIYCSMLDGGELYLPLIVSDKNKMYAEGHLPEDTNNLFLEGKGGEKFVAAFTNPDEDFYSKYPETQLSGIKNVFTEIIEGETEADGIALDMKVTLNKEFLKKILELPASENELFIFDGHFSELDVDAIVTSDYGGFKNISLDKPGAITYSHFMKEVQDNRYVIYTPLAYYDGDDADVFFKCCQACLDLAKRCHISSIVFPFYIVFSCGIPVIDAAIRDWFSRNKDYGMKYFLR